MGWIRGWLVTKGAALFGPKGIGLVCVCVCVCVVARVYVCVRVRTWLSCAESHGQATLYVSFAGSVCDHTHGFPPQGHCGTGSSVQCNANLGFQHENDGPMRRMKLTQELCIDGGREDKGNGPAKCYCICVG